jgi:hypothetical protein
MKSPGWKTYRTRFLVKAKQLTSTLSFTDHLGRQHCGRKGDYLVESYEGVISIAPRHIFEDIYVRMFEDGSSSELYSGSEETERIDGTRDSNHVLVEELKIERIRDAKFPVTDSPEKNSPIRPRRKSPQPVRDPPRRMSLM